MRGKEEELTELMERRKLDVLGLCETRWKGKGRKVVHNDYEIIYSGGDDTRHGVGVMLTPQMAERIKDENPKNERMLKVTIQLKQKRLHLIQVYAPQQGRPSNEKDNFYDELQEMCGGVAAGEDIIVMGDMNGHVGVEREGIETVVGAFGVGLGNREGERIVDFCVGNNMAIMNTYYKHQESHKWTWYRWNNEDQTYTDKSMIDMFLTNNKTLFRDVKAIPSESCDSDHRLVIGKLRIAAPKTRARTMQKRLLVENLKNEECVEQLQQRITENVPEGATNSAEEEWERYRRVVAEIAEEVIHSKRSCGTRKRRTPWWTEEVKTAVKEKTLAFRRWMRTRQVEDRNRYVEARNYAEAKKRSAKEESWQRIGRDLEQDMQGTRKLIYSLARGYRKGNAAPTYAIKNKDGTTLLSEPLEIARRWLEYFSELLNVEGQIEEEVENEEGDEQYEEVDIAMEEMEAAMKRMKNGKAPGDDELPVEIFKQSGVDGLKWLRRVMNTAWNTGQVPEDWSKAIICPIYKKGEKTDCGNYRGISLLSHAGKIYERVLERRLRVIVEEKIGEWQHGFRPGRGTIDLVFALKMLLEKSWEWGISKSMAFIDLEKAFDRIPRERLWEKLQHEEYGIPPKLMRAIKSIYKQCRSRVKSRDAEGQWFTVETGGCTVATFIYIVHG